MGGEHATSSIDIKLERQVGHKGFMLQTTMDGLHPDSRINRDSFLLCKGFFVKTMVWEIGVIKALPQLKEDSLNH